MTQRRPWIRFRGGALEERGACKAWANGRDALASGSAPRASNLCRLTNLYDATTPRFGGAFLGTLAFCFLHGTVRGGLLLLQVNRAPLGGVTGS